MAVDNSIFKLSSGGSSWTTYWTYPVGTQIQFIYYDDLLVGTGTGLYKHTESVGQEEQPSVNRDDRMITVMPNPARGGTRLLLTLSHTSPVRLEIIDMAGRTVATLADKSFTAGEYTFGWTTGDPRSRQTIPGLYFYRLITDDFRESGKILILP
jgi:hypothetical protein